MLSLSLKLYSTLCNWGRLPRCAVELEKEKEWRSARAEPFQQHPGSGDVQSQGLPEVLLKKNPKEMQRKQYPEEYLPQAGGKRRSESSAKAKSPLGSPSPGSPKLLMGSWS